MQLGGRRARSKCGRRDAAASIARERAPKAGFSKHFPVARVDRGEFSACTIRTVGQVFVAASREWGGGDVTLRIYLLVWVKKVYFLLGGAKKSLFSTFCQRP